MKERILLLCLVVLMGFFARQEAYAVVSQVQPTLAAWEKGIKVYYVSPLGGGLKNGSSESNALPFAQISTLMRSFTESSKIRMLPGLYQLNGTLDIRAPTGDKVLVIEGGDGATIKGVFDFSTLAGTSTGLRLRTGNIVIRGLKFNRVGFCIKAEKYSAISRVLIENIEATDVHSCILIDRDMEQPISDWVVRKSKIKGYYRVGVRLAGMQSQGFLVDKLNIDGAHTLGASDCYKVGIQLLSGVRNVHLRDTKIFNNIGSCGESYQQGDGIEADHKEGTPSGIFIENVQITNSGDAELDLKADNVRLHNVRTFGGEKVRYAFKVWAYDTYTCTHCFAQGVNKAYVNLNQANMTFADSTFSNHKPVHLCDLRHGETPELQSRIEFSRSRMYVGDEAWVPECGTNVLSSVKRMPMGKVPAPRPAGGLQVR